MNHTDKKRTEIASEYHADLITHMIANAYNTDLISNRNSECISCRVDNAQEKRMIFMQTCIRRSVAL